MVNFSSVVAWVTGNARDTLAMKDRMRSGYEGAVSDHVTRYDELGLQHYTRIAHALLESTHLQGKEVLDVGCGTGILSFLAMEQGCARLVGGDLSEYMLSRCRDKARSLGYGPERMDFRQLDGESLPFGDDEFDVIVSSMVLGLIPDQRRALVEMVRVLRPGGMLAISAHSPDLYREACETSFRAVPKRFTFGYRLEFWPRKEAEIALMFAQAGLEEVATHRLTWRESFEDGGQAYDFFASTSSAWWLARVPPGDVEWVSSKTRQAFESTSVTEITTDIVLAYGRKP